MSEKKLYKMFNKETGKTIAWFTDSDELFHITEWYEGSSIEYGVEVFKLIDEW